MCYRSKKISGIGQTIGAYRSEVRKGEMNSENLKSADQNASEILTQMME